ncbi:hypothetical protein [Phyllobacterium chamaecytisi]|nr:hypothetical protein [Phyllobacterium sp. KW56]
MGPRVKPEDDGEVVLCDDGEVVLWDDGEVVNDGKVVPGPMMER